MPVPTPTEFRTTVDRFIGQGLSRLDATRRARTEAGLAPVAQPSTPGDIRADIGSLPGQPQDIIPDFQTRMTKAVTSAGVTGAELSDPRIQELLARSAFNAEELRSLGIGEETLQQFGQVAQEAEAAREAIPTLPTRSGLGVLEQALRAKSDPAKDPRLKSQLFEQLGLTGIASVMPSMREAQRESERTFAEFTRGLKDVARANIDEFNISLSRFNLINQEKQQMIDRFQQFEDEERAINNELRLFREKGKIQQELDLTAKPTISEAASLFRDGLIFDPEAPGGVRPLTILDEIGFDTSGRMLQPGTATVTDYKALYAGSRTNRAGLDLAGDASDWGKTPIRSPINGIIIDSSGSRGRGLTDFCQPGERNCGGGWGNNLRILDPNTGEIHQLSHMLGVVSGLGIGDSVTAGQVLGSMGNTGTVIGGGGEDLSNEQITGPNKRGTHLDYTIFNDNGTKKTVEEVLPFAFPERAKVGVPGVDLEAQSIALDILDPLSGQRLTDVTQAKGMRSKVSAHLTSLRRGLIEQGDLIGFIEASAGGKDVDASFLVSFDKFATVIDQIDALGEILNKKGLEGVEKETEADDPIFKFDAAPLINFIQSRNPWAGDAQTVKAILTATVPNLARGVYGEVGVLTDRDVRLYMDTLPTLSQPEEIRKSITAFTLRTLRNAIIQKMMTQAAGGRDVSRFAPIITDLTDKITRMEADLGIGVDVIGLQELADRVGLDVQIQERAEENFLIVEESEFGTFYDDL